MDVSAGRLCHLNENDGFGENVYIQCLLKACDMDKKDDRGAEKAFGNFGKRIDQFVDELHEASEKLQKEFQEKYEELKKSAEKVKEEVKSDDRWRDVEASLRKAGDELANAFRAAFSRRDKSS